jgi:hypothetical protein
VTTVGKSKFPQEPYQNRPQRDAGNHERWIFPDNSGLDGDPKQQYQAGHRRNTEAQAGHLGILADAKMRRDTRIYKIGERVVS